MAVNMTSDTPILYCTLTGGTANRLYGLVTCVVLGLLTERAVYIDWPTTAMEVGNLDDFLEEPGIAWQHPVLKRRSSKVPSDTVMLGCIAFWNNTKYMRDLLRKNYTRLWGAPVLNGCFSVNTLSIFMSNGHYAATMRRWFGPDHADAFRIVAAYVIRPVSEIVKNATSFYRSHFGAYTIALQVRKGALLQNGPAQDVDFMPGCAVDVALFCTRLRVTAAIERLSMEKQGNASTSVKVLLVTDSERMRGLVKAELGDMMIYYPGVLSRLSVQGIRTAFVENLLLQRADEIMVSSANQISTFGSLAHALGNSIGWYIRDGGCYNQPPVPLPMLIPHPDCNGAVDVIYSFRRFRTHLSEVVCEADP